MPYVPANPLTESSTEISNLHFIRSKNGINYQGALKNKIRYIKKDKNGNVIKDVYLTNATLIRSNESGSHYTKWFKSYTLNISYSGLDYSNISIERERDGVTENLGNIRQLSVRYGDIVRPIKPSQHIHFSPLSRVIIAPGNIDTINQSISIQDDIFDSISVYTIVKPQQAFPSKSGGIYCINNSNQKINLIAQRIQNESNNLNSIYGDGAPGYSNMGDYAVTSVNAGESGRCFNAYFSRSYEETSGRAGFGYLYLYVMFGDITLSDIYQMENHDRILFRFTGSMTASGYDEGYYGATLLPLYAKTPYYAGDDSIGWGVFGESS